MKEYKGFTLVELLVVISMVGILATIVTISAIHAQSSGRDAQRKTDLSSISEGFIARYSDRTCTNQAFVGQYPNGVSSDATNGWVAVSDVKTNNSCGGSTFVPTYLSKIPVDPNNNSYIFNLSSDTKHFRLGASLEGSSKTDLKNCQSQSQSWKYIAGSTHIYENTILKGVSGCTEKGYNYFIGQ